MSRSAHSRASKAISWHSCKSKLLAQNWIVRICQLQNAISQSADASVAPSTGRLVVIILFGCELEEICLWRNGENQKKSLYSFTCFQTVDHLVFSYRFIRWPYSATFIKSAKQFHYWKTALLFLVAKWWMSGPPYLLKIVWNTVWCRCI